MAGPVGFEPMTFSLEGKGNIDLRLQRTLAKNSQDNIHSYNLGILENILVATATLRILGAFQVWRLILKPNKFS